jgi:hypothetical protein
MSMGSYPKDITRSFLVLSMSTAICFPIRSIAEQQTYCTLGAIQFAIAILSDRLSLTRNVTEEQEDLWGIRPNYFETLCLASFQISRISRPHGPSARRSQTFFNHFAQRFCWNRRKQRDVKFTSGSPLMILKRMPGKVFCESNTRKHGLIHEDSR